METRLKKAKLETTIIFLPFFFFFFFFALFTPSATADPRTADQSGLFCGAGRPPPSAAAAFIPTFVKEMEALSSQLINNKRKFATYHLNNSILPFYALTQCHADLSQTDCLLCYAAARTKLPRCLPAVSARIYLDGCFLRYDNYSFYTESVSPSLDNFTCGGGGSAAAAEFADSVKYAVGNVTRTAAEGSSLFGVAEVGGRAYALAQCWESVGRDGCKECLSKAAAAVVGGCLPRREGRALNAGCYLKYSDRKFYGDGGGRDNSHGDSTLGLIMAIALASAAFAMLTFFAAYAIHIKRLKSNQARRNLGKVSISFNKSSMNFKYEALEKATNYFSPSKKLGQGGAGAVFIGTLPTGQTVAVKRLIFNTSQWVEEFFNEVNLISGIHHKNLVKLLGCSIEGPESLLVYEYVANRSLDQFLFEKNDGKEKVKVTLSWKQRVNIVLGAAEGLAYLHGEGGSPVRIIHRDIKSSNVLLDEDFNAKIADFGLVRHFGADKSHLSTGIAGTIGYMAPEYLVRGQLTEKADVYSFGVLVLEIVSGRRCSAVIGESNSLLQAVWFYYRTDRLIEAVDPSLNGDFPTEEATFVLRIGLLCSQASVSLRPSMGEVIKMLTNHDLPIAAPSQPPFMRGSDLLDPDASFRSRSTYSSVASNGESSTKESSSLLSSLIAGRTRSRELTDE